MQIKITVKSAEGETTIIGGNGSEAAERLREYNHDNVGVCDSSETWKDWDES